MRRRLEVTVAALLVIAAAAALAVWANSRSHVEVGTGGGAQSSTAVTASKPSTTTAATSSSTAPPTTLPPPKLLSEGATGPEVVALQQRLQDLGYWLENTAGTYDDSTMHAVVAFQKTEGLDRDGVAGPLTRAALATATGVVPRSTAGRVFEIDREHQLLLDVWDGRVRWVFDTATGADAGTTPVGQWHVEWQIDGWVHSRLGILYRPKYFHDGVAIHGNPSVPPYPASHGCVRVINAAMDWIWANNELPIGTAVWVY